jgi:DNA-binding NtrC family response regulator
VDYFIQRFAQSAGKSITGITSKGLKRLTDFHWPGNVRELENIIERAVALSTSPVINEEDVRLDDLPSRLPDAAVPFLPEGMTLEQWEDEMIKEALHRAKNNKSQAARMLGLSRNALRYRLSKMGLPDE